jgi:amidohydrolase
MGISAGPVSGAVSKFQIRIHGHGSHAAHPNEGRSPIRVAAELIAAIESIPDLDVNPATPRAVTVTHVESGSTWNVIPDDAFIEGTVRTLGNHTRDTIHERFIALTAGLGTAYAVDIELTWEDGSPSVDNNAALAERGREVANDLSIAAAESVPSLSGEDFSYYQQRIPGLFVHAGVGADAGALHGPHFTPDIAGLADTATLLAGLAKDALTHATIILK